MDRKYKTLRAVSATDDTGLAAGGAKYSDVSGDLVALGSEGQLGEIAIVFKGTDAADEDMNWCLYAVRDEDQPAEYIAHGTATLGATGTGNTNEYYADTITITNSDWVKPLTVTGGYQYNLGTGEVAGAGIAKLNFDGFECKFLLCLMSKGTCATCGADYALVY